MSPAPSGSPSRVRVLCRAFRLASGGMVCSPVGRCLSSGVRRPPPAAPRTVFGACRSHVAPRGPHVVPRHATRTAPPAPCHAVPHHATPSRGPWSQGSAIPAIHPGFAFRTPRGDSLHLTGRHGPRPNSDREAYGHGERTRGPRRSSVRAVRRRTPAVDRDAGVPPRAGGSRSEPPRFRHARHTVRRTFSRSRCVVLHSHLIHSDPFPTRALPVRPPHAHLTPAFPPDSRIPL